jgi:hypothetical protein
MVYRKYLSDEQPLSCTPRASQQVTHPYALRLADTSSSQCIVASTRPSRLDLNQLLIIIVITAPVPPNINSIVLIVQRSSLFRLSGTRSTSKPTLILLLATKLKLLVRRILIAAESATESAFVVAEMQACFTQLGFRRRG